MVASTQNPQHPDVAKYLELITTTLEDTKARDIVTMDVREVTEVTDSVVIASGTSNRHVRALANAVSSDAKKAGFTVIGTEGEVDGEWILVDLGSVVVHLMLAKTRESYDLESLWDVKNLPVVNEEEEL